MSTDIVLAACCCGGDPAWSTEDCGGPFDCDAACTGREYRITHAGASVTLCDFDLGATCSTSLAGEATITSFPCPPGGDLCPSGLPDSEVLSAGGPYYDNVDIRYGCAKCDFAGWVDPAAMYHVISVSYQYDCAGAPCGACGPLSPGLIFLYRSPGYVLEGEPRCLIEGTYTLWDVGIGVGSCFCRDQGGVPTLNPCDTDPFNPYAWPTAITPGGLLVERLP